MSFSGTLFTYEREWIHKPHSFDFTKDTDKTLCNDFISKNKTNNKMTELQSSLYINQTFKEKKGATSLIMYTSKRSKSLYIKTDQIRNIAQSRYSAPLPMDFHHLLENEKPLPAIPIEIAKPMTLKKKSYSFDISSRQQLAHYRTKNIYIPLTLGDIADIKDRDKRLAAYDHAFENCLLAASPLTTVIKKLKKKPPLQNHAQPQAYRQSSGKTFTFSSLLQLTKKESMQNLSGFNIL